MTSWTTSSAVRALSRPLASPKLMRCSGSRLVGRSVPPPRRRFVASRPDRWSLGLAPLSSVSQVRTLRI